MAFALIAGGVAFGALSISSPAKPADEQTSAEQETPEIKQQEQPSAAAVPEQEPAPDTAREPEPTPAPVNPAAEAQTALQAVIDDYRSLADDSAKLSKDDLASRHPYVNSMALPNYLMDWADNGFSNVCYAFSDLNGDDVPELIIGCKNAQSDTQAFDIWSYVNNAPVRVAYSWERSIMRVCAGGYLYERGSGGFQDWMITVSTLSVYPTSIGDAWTDYTNGFNGRTDNLNVVEKLGMESGTYVKIDAQGNKTAITAEQFQTENQTIEQQYPADSSIDWIPLIS
ncbi:hypothetical protein [uncultured Senegalimassilia sp.]|uniref:hypothetical protein n=1 Tax=uncultured Senegalimassilia sp. TaxID=1714350 RepID=UPI002600D02E|nr:hypothetical protein [uncultured Senegalimassilia sp.]